MKQGCEHNTIKLYIIGIGQGLMKHTWQCEKCGQYFEPKAICPECNHYDDKKCYHKDGACSTQIGLYQNFEPKPIIEPAIGLPIEEVVK